MLRSQERSLSLVSTSLTLLSFISCCSMLGKENPKPNSGREKLNAICNRSMIKKGQPILESNLQLTFVKTPTWQSRPVQNLDYLRERIATKQYPPGHVFTYSDFGFPEIDWPTGNNLVVCAVRDIKKGSIIKISDIAQRKYNHSEPLQGGFSDMNFVLNRSSKFEIKKGQILILPDVGLGMDYYIRMQKRKRI